MATSAEAICNQALTWLGANKITDLGTTEDSDEWRLCDAHYVPLRDTVLAEREWTFAVERAGPISAEVALPVNGFDKKFAKPAGCIRALQVSNASEDASASNQLGIGRYNRVEWLVEGDFIVALGVEQIYLRYIQRITDTTKFPAIFDQALAARLAMEFTLPLTQSRLLLREMTALYGEKLAIAAAADGSQGRSYRNRATRLIDVR